MAEIRLSELIAPAFYPVHADIRRGAHTHYWLKGGRASGKSSFASVEIMLGLMREPEANAIVYRKVANTLADSVAAQCLWAAGMLGTSAYWRFCRSPYELIYQPTGQRVLFRGADNAEKSKGIKLADGYFKYVWFEELSEFHGMDEIETVLRSLVRGERHASVIYTYNPPKSRSSWVNAEALRVRPDRLTHHSTYLDLPPAWLGEQFLAEAEATRTSNELKYRWAYMGEATGTGGAVFDNVALREISDGEIAGLDRVYRGVDWGWYPDPYAYNAVGHSASRRAIYVFDELHCHKRSNAQTCAALKERGVGGGDLIIADSAEPKSVGDYRAFGLLCRGAQKGPGSLDYSMKWLQGLSEIVVDPARCPHTAREFTGYEYDRDRDGEIISGYPDAGNHHIDAVRYAMSPVWRRRGA